MSQRVTYRITVDGRLGAHWADWFDGMTLGRDEAGRTVLVGRVPDQAALYGILLKIRDLGVPLVSVWRS